MPPRVDTHTRVHTCRLSLHGGPGGPRNPRDQDVSTLAGAQSLGDEPDGGLQEAQKNPHKLKLQEML